MTNLLSSGTDNKTFAKNHSGILNKTCAQALVEMLQELGVDNIFGYPGASILSVYNALSEAQNIRHILVRHEQAAVHAAEGYARVKYEYKYGYGGYTVKPVKNTAVSRHYLTEILYPESALYERHEQIAQL